ncbi:hypothetical protein BD410DRAFT_788567 [Rickenella mellea]|uniref:Uncharacterized protein n=1 Tax=Rickenella mellea TaxID=50990 RepID=A0A4Y7Q534_9AGAM|nr:hypothetical protein BD410DRAFT_788567 [Rickenella mellea]
MSSIPYDLLPQIFQICFLNQRTENFGCRGPSTNEVPLLLLRVCRTWRECALSTPFLWSRLSVGRGRNRLLSVIAAKDWLDRAGSITLSIDIYLCDANAECGRSTRHATELALNDIFAPARIWNSVSLEVERPWANPFFDTILQPVLTHAPELEKISISLTGSKPIAQLNAGPATMTIIEIGSTPNLSSISVHIERSTYHAVRITFSNVHSYAHIRELNLHRPESTGHCLEILRRCHNVELLRVSLKICHGDVQPHITVLLLDKLHTLDLTIHADTDPDALVFGWPHLFQLLERSHPPLKAFGLTGALMKSIDIIRCLQHASAHELTVISGDRRLFSPRVIDALTPRSAGFVYRDNYDL